MGRNMWCTASLIHASGRRIWHRGDAYACRAKPPPGTAEVEIFAFTPACVEIDRTRASRDRRRLISHARAEIDPSGRTVLMEEDEAPHMHLLTVRDAVAYSPTMSGCLRDLLLRIVPVSGPVSGPDR